MAQRIRSRRRRRGFTLAECLVAIFLTSATLTAIACMMHALYRAEHQLRDALDGQRSLARFDTQLRTDAHQALSAELAATNGDDGRGQDLVLSLSDKRRVRYLLSADSARRIVSTGSTETHRESYVLPGTPAGWQLLEDTPSPRIALRLDRIVRGVDPPIDPPPVAYLQVAVGIVASPLSQAGEANQ